MPATYERITSVTLGSAVTNFTLSSIPNTYTDLRLIMTATMSNASDSVLFRLNSDGASNYSYTRLNGNGTTAASNRGQNATIFFTTSSNTMSTTIPTFYTLDVFNYTSSANKGVLWTANTDLNGSGLIEKGAGVWRNSAAVTSIYVFSINGYNFQVGTTATLYGILKA